MFSSLRLWRFPIAGGSSRNKLARRLRTLRYSSLNSSPGRVVRAFAAKKIFKSGSICENTPWITGGTGVNVASGRIVALDNVASPRELFLLC